MWGQDLMSFPLSSRFRSLEKCSSRDLEDMDRELSIHLEPFFFFKVKVTEG
jgi:hypothetical protein